MKNVLKTESSSSFKKKRRIITEVLKESEEMFAVHDKNLFSIHNHNNNIFKHVMNYTQKK